MFSLSNWFTPSLALFSLSFSAFISLPLSHMNQLPFHPLSALLSPSPRPCASLSIPPPPPHFSLFQISSFVSSCSPTAPSCWTLLQSCCNWNMLRRLCRWSLSLSLWAFSSLHLSIFNFFNHLPHAHIYTHTLSLIHYTGAVQKDKLQSLSVSRRHCTLE